MKTKYDMLLEVYVYLRNNGHDLDGVVEDACRIVDTCWGSDMSHNVPRRKGASFEDVDPNACEHTFLSYPPRCTQCGMASCLNYWHSDPDRTDVRCEDCGAEHGKTKCEHPWHAHPEARVVDNCPACNQTGPTVTYTRPETGEDVGRETASADSKKKCPERWHKLTVKENFGTKCHVCGENGAEYVSEEKLPKPCGGDWHSQTYRRRYGKTCPDCGHGGANVYYEEYSEEKCQHEWTVRRMNKEELVCVKCNKWQGDAEEDA